MDHYQGIVAEYLRANRAVFVNTECFIQIEPGDSPPKGTSWFCDIVAVNLREHKVHLCEVTYSRSMDALKQRLKAWDANWKQVCQALWRDCAISPEWIVTPWVFVPRDLAKSMSMGTYLQMPSPQITALEEIVPWKYRSWDRNEDTVFEGSNL